MRNCSYCKNAKKVGVGGGLRARGRLAAGLRELCGMGEIWHLQNFI